MCESLLCVQLKESLGAAFCSQAYEGDEAVRIWGHDVVNALSKPYYGGGHSRGVFWQIASKNLQNMQLNCPCHGLAQAILRNPLSFLRTTLILASELPLGRNPARPPVLH